MKAVARLFALALLCPSAMADEAGPHLVFAKPIDRPAAKYPSQMLNSRQQGWVDLEFVISPEGKAIEPVVDASSGQSAFESAALKAIEDWRFEPSTRDGEAVPQRSRVRLSFALEGDETKVSRSFFRRYRKMERAVERGEIDAAVEYLEQAFEAKRLTVGELAWLWTMQARIAILQGDEQEALISLRQALANSENWIPEDLHAGLLRSSFALELNNRYFAVALDVYDRLNDIDGYDTAELDPIVDQVMALIESDKLIATQAEIGAGNNCETCATRWRHELLRRSVEITNIDGELESIDFRCDWARYTDTAREGVGWELPENWGDCSVIVTGATGATFKLVELPLL